jgi:hypothetical protein
MRPVTPFMAIRIVRRPVVGWKTFATLSAA